jgi:lysophospholipase L1-like esterase
VIALAAAAVWIGSWAAAPVRADEARSFRNDTLREVMHVSVGGTQVRVRFTNRFGDAPIAIGGAAIALQQSGSDAVPATVRRLTFARRDSITIPPHADVYSDPVSLAVPARSNVLVDLYLPGPTGPATEHALAYQTNYYALGERTGVRDAEAFSHTFESWYLVDGIDVSGSAARGAIVALGDSITDGAGGKKNANDRWPDFLSDRIGALPAQQQFGVLNEGISGNRILLDHPLFGLNALARFDADVLAQSGATAVMLLLGVNDIQQDPHQYDPAPIEQGLEQLALQAHARGLRVIACTITPFEGWMTYEPQGEAARRAVNEFIRSSGIFDAVADFDAAVRDPQHQTRLLPAYDSGDHLHPNALGHRAMAAAIDLRTL